MKNANLKFIIIILAVSIASIFASGCVYSGNQTTTTLPTTTIETPSTTCESLYWFDSSHYECGYKQFCGAYMYLGLHTFATLNECETTLNETLSNDYVTITSAPTGAATNSTFVISWYVNSTPGQTHYTAVHYGPLSVSNPSSPASYPYVSSVLCAGTPCDIPAPFSVQMSVATPGLYYYRVHAIVSGLDIWSDERTINITASITPVVRQFLIEADDYGFYMNDTAVSQITVNRNDLVNITFRVRTSNVYHGGLDFRGCNQNASALPGQDAVMQFTTNVNCPISSYWPSTGVLKSTVTVLAI